MIRESWFMQVESCTWCPNRISKLICIRPKLVFCLHLLHEAYDSKYLSYYNFCIALTRMFRAKRPLKSASIGSASLLSRTTDCNQFIVVKTDKVSKLWKSIPATEATATTVQTMFTIARLSNFGRPSTDPADDVPLFP